MPPAARITDMHVCPMVTVLVPHVGGPILPAGCPTVLIGALPAARVGDMAVCVGPPDVIVRGSATVLIGSMPAARISDNTAHGGMIVAGCPTVMIGGSGSGAGGGGGAGAGAADAMGPDATAKWDAILSAAAYRTLARDHAAAASLIVAARTGAALIWCGPG